MEKFQLKGKKPVLRAVVKEDGSVETKDMKTPRLAVTAVSYEGDQGTAINHTIIESAPSVAVLVFNQHHEIAFIRQFRSTTGKYYMEIPAGLKNLDDADMVDAARREVAEEAGFTVKDAEILDSSPNLLDPSKSDEDFGIAIAEVVSQGQRNLDEAEAIDAEIIWIQEVEVKVRLLRSIKFGAPFYGELFLSGHTKNALLTYFFLRSCR